MAIQTRYIYFIGYLLPVLDVVTLNTLYLLSGYLTGGMTSTLFEEAGKNDLIVCNLIWLFCSAAMGLYAVTGNQKVEKLYRLTVKSLLLHLLMYGVYFYFSKVGHLSVNFILIFYLLFPSMLMVGRFVGSMFYDLFMHRDKANKKVAIMGSNGTALRFSSFLQNQRNLEFYGFLGGDESIYGEESGIISSDISQQFMQAASQGVTDVYVAVRPDRLGEANALIREADRYCVRLKFIPDLGASMTSAYSLSYIGNEFPVITLRNEPLEELGNRYVKRVFDIVFSLLVIVLVFCWLFPVLAIWIKLNSKGPVFFRQLRSGRNDQSFWCYKFRTMHVNDTADIQQAKKDDGRITSIGRFLRRTSLDELPQFFNVLMGNMSVIGPRPHMLKHTSQYKEVISQFMVRHFLKPGITGWAQVNGYRGETREQKDMENRVRYDIYYLENWTVIMDIKIVFKTITNVWRGEDNAY